MKKATALLFGVFGLSSLACIAQETPTQVPDTPTPSATRLANRPYSPPTQGERFKSYLKQTYGIMSLFEAGMHAGIAQARDNPSQWPEGAEGYGDRFGSAYGEIVVRGTTEYALADLFREDVRRVRCSHPCGESRFKIAFDNTFLARKGDDGHEAFSVARVISPFSGSAVAVNTWYPGGSGGKDIAKEAALQFGLRYIRNLIR
jgi:hypothetical protein